jgi:hypothetical protein
MGGHDRREIVPFLREASAADVKRGFHVMLLQQLHILPRDTNLRQRRIADVLLVIGHQR